MAATVHIWPDGLLWDVACSLLGIILSAILSTPSHMHVTHTHTFYSCTKHTHNTHTHPLPHTCHTHTHAPAHTPHTHTPQASSANSSQDYDTAKKLGRASLAWNIGVYIFNTLAIIAIVVAVVVVQVNAVRSRCIINAFGRTVCY